MIAGHPALRTLARLKLRAALRRQRRRLRRPSGWIFALLGLGLTSFWLLALIVGGGGSERLGAEPLSSLRLVQAGIAALGVMTALGAFSYRGLYLPAEEIERLFSAPVPRSDLVRYRLWVGVARSGLAGVFFVALTWGRFASTLFGALGVLVGILTLPLVGQATALLLGDAENRAARLFARLPLKGVHVLIGIVLWLLLMGLFVFDDELGGLVRGLGPGGGGVRGLLEHPALGVLLAPTLPWARAATAGDWATFLPWFGLCLGLWLGGFALIARLPIDYRELSLSTSAEVAQRLRRLKSGGLGAAPTAARNGRPTGRPPWLFGRGTFGAVAWLKVSAIQRKARGTVLVSLLIVAGLTVVASFIVDAGEEAQVLGGAVLVSALGTLYLCAGLRFDFRTELDRMEALKAWPLAPWKLFLATLLPEVVLVSALLAVGVLAQAALAGTWHPLLPVLALALPTVVLAWVAIDNAVFLVAPVRMVPGQEGALHHAGRSAVLMLLRGLFVLLVGLPAGVVGGGSFAALTGLDLLPRVPAAAVGMLLGALVLLFADVGLIAAGGRALARFDVARDRG